MRFFYQMSIRLESLNMLLTTTLSVPFNVKELTMMLLVGYDNDDDGDDDDGDENCDAFNENHV